MAPTALSAPTESRTHTKLPLKVAALACARPTHILHRTPWRPSVATSAEGSYITLEDGRVLIDGVGGASVACIGMGNPDVVRAIQEQVAKVAYVYNMQLSNQPAEDLADYLIAISKGAFDMVGIVSGGSEAMEAVIKTARQYWYETGHPERKNFIGRKLSFHGNTVTTLSLAYHPTRRLPYADILDTNVFHHVSPAYAARFQLPEESEEQYVERLRAELEAKFLELGPHTVAAFVAETVVGATTGVVPAPRGYFKAMKSVCDKYGALFVLDEVMCGMGRMGTLHAWESFGDGIAPDLQAVAKGLGGGYASIGAILMSKKVVNGIRDGSGFWLHGHTYQATPIACAASLAVQKVIARDDLLANCREQGEYLASLLRQRLAPPSKAAPYIFDIRGGGMFWGIEFTTPTEDDTFQSAYSKKYGSQKLAMLVQERCMSKGLIILGFTGGADLTGKKGDHSILSPAYTVTREEVRKIVSIYVDVVEEIFGALDL
ncbi:PLP-dependent transferase [Sistotremastrum suecicum HHB10207 ss-3]|uniref:PLP-dependent transferase n=1 Tax=Sistotremastrum suecicum HHB10207 ss-3 TaxID=1314776 RepID=A0A166J349_9AGAM|nr:PLP-dependent transferase [Sistotremastrum suecicum HHB10207 ss-3]